MRTIDYQKKTKTRLHTEEISSIDYKSRLGKNNEQKKDLLLAIDGKSFYPSAIVDKDSCYLRRITGYLFTPDEGEGFVNQFINRTFTQLKDQSSTFFKVRYYNPKNLNIQTFNRSRRRFLDGKRLKDASRLRNGYDKQVLTNVY